MRNVYIIEGDTVYVENQHGERLTQYYISLIWEGNGEVKARQAGDDRVLYTATSPGELVGMIIDGEEDGE